MDARGPTLEKAQRYGLPERWLNCPKVGELVHGLFLPFKTPMCSLYDEQVVDKKKRFHAEHVFNHPNLGGKKIGLWIDLTKTDRYYSDSEVKSHGIQYCKMRLTGHGAAPTEDETNRFMRAVTEFFNDNPGKVCAIHCTHGFNRTGFLIAAYFVEQMGFAADAAVGLFAAARQPGIYKQDYIDTFVTRYGDQDDQMEAPERPNWEYGGDTAYMDDMNSVNGNAGTDSSSGDGPSTSSAGGGDEATNGTGRKPKKQFMDGRVEFATWVDDESKKAMLRGKIKDICKADKKGFPGSQPVSLDRNNIKMLAQEKYMVSWKADGMRYLVYIADENNIYAFDRDNEVFQIKGISFPHRKEPRHVQNTLVDTEMIIDVINGEERPRLLIYDIIQFEGFNLAKENFDVRFECIDKELIKPRHEAMKSGRIRQDKEPTSVRRKDFWLLSATSRLFEESFTRHLGHEVDGIIFQPVKRRYKPGRDDAVLKWKPPSHNSIDFRLQIKKFKQEGCLPEYHGYLYVQGSHEPISEMKVTKSLQPYDGRIIECRWNNMTRSWEFMRERTDKSLPNAKSTAMAVWDTMMHPISQEDLCDFIAKCAFNEKKRPMPPPQQMRGGELIDGNEQPPAQRARTSYSWNGKSPCTVLRSANISLMLDCFIDLTAINSFMPQLYTDSGRFKSTQPDGKQFGLPYLRQIRNNTYVDATPEVHPVPLDLLQMDSIDCILVSNLQSIVALPFYVIETGFRGTVYATEPIVQFGRILMEEWVEYFERHSKGESDDKWKKFSVCGKFANAPRRNPLQWRQFYSREDMEKALGLITTISFKQETPILGSVSFTAHPSGYTIGSANWMINIEGDEIAYISSASNRAMHARPAEWDGLKNADYLILTSLSLTSESPEYSLLNLCAHTVDTLRAGGNVLIPISSVGIVYDLIEVLVDKIDKTQGLSADPPCVYFISPAAKSSIAFANINAEYLRDMRQANVYVPDEPFNHSNLIKNGRLKIYSSVCDDFSKEYKRPCVVLAGHPSLRMGDAVQLLEMWSGDVANSLIVIDPDYPLNEMFGPFQGQGNIRPYYFPIETRLDYNEADKTLSQLKPKSLYIHDSFMRLPDVMPNQAPVIDLTIQYPNYMPLHYNEPFPVVSKKAKKRKITVNSEVQFNTLFQKTISK
ncbi:hypothetical protein WR25_24634 isoform B [Diploscapter pachys]|uniref:mRNA guanylyltransferase n=1 Tax=Diploscapter pachys TaxID=2018661 RepID=A0A2A2JZJ2_9BILA|nr:hypothetical protein WR25_24634 isoform B [Diploscapter pachys]